MVLDSNPLGFVPERRLEASPGDKVLVRANDKELGLRNADDKCAYSQPHLGLEATRGKFGAADR